MCFDLSESYLCFDCYAITVHLVENDLVIYHVLIRLLERDREISLDSSNVLELTIVISSSSEIVHHSKYLKLEI